MTNRIFQILRKVNFKCVRYLGHPDMQIRRYADTQTRRCAMNAGVASGQLESKMGSGLEAMARLTEKLQNLLWEIL